MVLRLLVALVVAASALGVPLAQHAWAEPTEHMVQPGETLTRIAQQYGLTLADLLAVNDLPNPDLILIGQVLSLPGAAPAPEPAAEPPEVDAAAPAEAPPRARPSARGGFRPPEATHVVQPGETLGRIARQYGLTAADLLAVNELPNPHLLQVGQELLLPGDGAPAAVDAEPAAAVAGESAAAQPAERWPAVGGRYPIGTTLSGRITMYCLRGVMRYGEYVHEGAAAADPSVFPGGTIVEVAGLGRYVVKDTFARDLGDVRLDIWSPSCAAAIVWGLRYRDITVVGP